MYKDDNRLYFWKMGGKVIIRCAECDFEETTVSFLHGVNWDSTGYQCQKCGKLHAIERDMANSKGKLCDCGGKLDRDKPIFCPNCISFNVAYHILYIT